MLFADPAQRMRATVLVVWDNAQREPWVLVMDLAPREVGVCWYGLRVWVELGFRALKSVGWEGQRTRRSADAAPQAEGARVLGDVAGNRQFRRER